MKSVAIYNMKGGVGKTTTAVNLSYLAAGSGQRTLLWDLDPQAASSFAFRVRPRVSGFDKTSLEDGRTLGAAIKETDYNNLFHCRRTLATASSNDSSGLWGSRNAWSRSCSASSGATSTPCFLTVLQASHC